MAAFLIAVTALLWLAAPALGAGLAPPRAITPNGGTADEPLAVVAPNGRAAVLWRRITRSRIAYVAAVGPSPGRLGAPRAVGGGGRAADARAGAFADGTIVACFGDETFRSRTAAIRCGTAPPGRPFGRAHTVRRYAARQHPVLLDVVGAPDGRIVVAYKLNADTGNEQLLWAVARPGGRFSAPRSLGKLHYGSAQLGLAPDGSVALTWSTPNTPAIEDRAPVLRLLAPGAADFAPPTTFTSERHVVFGVGVTRERAGLAVAYASNDDRLPRVVLQRADGTFEDPVPLPPTADRGFVGGKVVFAPDGAPAALSQTTRESNSDCSETNFGRVGAGPLSGPPAILSQTKQIAYGIDGAVLADGTLLTVWEDALHADGSSRLEYALRPPGGAFTAGRPLPFAAARGLTFAAGGSEALLAWVTGDLPDGPSRLIVSSYRTAPPYAKVAPRPGHPASPCG